MELRQYLDILVRRRWVIILTVLVTVLVAALGSRLERPSYSATALVRIAQASSGSVQYGDYVYAERLINTYGELVKSRPFLEEVIAGLDLSEVPESLARQVKVAVLPNTELLQITAEDSDPARAMAIANTLANLLALNSQTLYFGGAKSAREILEEQLSVADSELTQDRSALQVLLNDPNKDEERISSLRTKIQLQEDVYANLLTQYEAARVEEAARANSVSVSAPAAQPLEPSKPRMKLNIALGLLVGLVAGVGLAFLVETLDPTMHTASEAETTVQVSFLGSIPEEAGAERSSGAACPAGGTQARVSGTAERGVGIVDHEGHSPASEAYRILRTNIFSESPGAPLKSLLVTSPEPGTGKSTVSANLAVTLAESGRTVILIDADLRRPRIHTAFGLPNETGLSTLLSSEGDVGDPLQRTQRRESALQKATYPRLRVLTSGPLPSNPTGLLGSDGMRALIAELAGDADIVVIDSPPILAVADATILAPMLDGVLLVTARDQSTGNRAQRALQLLDKAGARPLGLVFNRAQRRAEDYYYRYSKAAAPRRGRAERVQLALAVAGVLLVVCVVSLGVLTLLAGPDLRGAGPGRLIAADWSYLSAALSPGSQGDGRPLSSTSVEAAPFATAPGTALPPGRAGGDASQPELALENSTAITSVPLVTGPTPTTIRLRSGTPTATMQGTARGPGTVSGGSGAETGDASQGSMQPIATAEAVPTTPLGELSGSPTAQPPGAAETPQETPAPAIPWVGYIASGQGGLSGGTFLLEDPYWNQPGAIWLPDGWLVEVLEQDVPGRMSFGSNRWHRVRCTIGGQVYVGFVPAKAVVSKG
jgi:capsular exopolysaccharide synthesis family protein